MNTPPETEIQPPWAPVVQGVLEAWQDQPGALLPILHGIQDALGYVPAQSVPMVAEALNLSRAEVHGVISYYHHFRSEAPGRHIVQVCRAEACQARGAQALWEHACERVGCADTEHGGVSADGAFTLLPVYCLGLCASSPAMAVGERVHARLTPEKLNQVLAQVAAQEA